MTTNPPAQTPITEHAPAKINLTLHVTGRRPDGYHLLDSLVVFADLGDRINLTPADTPQLRVTGPLAEGVPTGPSNLVIRAMAFAGQSAAATLDKHLPAAAGIGGGSSDAAAVLRGLARLHQTPLPSDTHRLGADIPVCLIARAARMQGIGETVTALPALPPLHAVLVNPRVEVPTPAVFKSMTTRDNPPMPAALPQWDSTDALIHWVATMRNDLEAPARAIAPVITEVLSHLRTLPECQLARMSGSGATCFALTDSRAGAESMANALSDSGWWVHPVTLR